MSMSNSNTLLHLINSNAILEKKLFQSNVIQVSCVLDVETGNMHMQ